MFTLICEHTGVLCSLHFAFHADGREENSCR